MPVQCQERSGEAACSPEVGAAGEERLPTDPQLPGGCSGMGQVSSCSLEGDSLVPDQNHDPNSSLSHLFAV